MEPISLILAALLAGVAKGAGQTAANAVQDAYRGFRDALKRRLAGSRLRKMRLSNTLPIPKPGRETLRFTSSRPEQIRTRLCWILRLR